MINMIFALNYHQQLRKTQSGFFVSVENSIIELIESCGGKVTLEHKHLTASFDEQTIAFWLDLLILIEKLDQILKNSSDELYGHVCLFCSDAVQLEFYGGMLRELAAHGNHTGIWIARDIASHLLPYCDFDDGPALSFVTKNIFDVIQIRQVKNIDAEDEDKGIAYPLRKNIMDVLEDQKNQPYVVLTGPSFFRIKDGLYHFSKIYSGAVPPLVFRFGSGGRGLSCIVDALGPELKQWFADNVVSFETLNQLESLQAVIACERLRDEYPSITIKKAEQFLSLLTACFMETAAKHHADPIIIFEDIEEMNEAAFALVIQKVKDLQALDGISIYCTNNRDEDLDVWKKLNFKTIFFSLPDGQAAELSNRKKLPGDMKELWEIASICYLMRPYFPAYALLSLFNEERKNPAVTERAFKILNGLGLISSLQDPKPVMDDFAEEAGNVLGEERFCMINAMVRNRLTAWVAEEKLFPCVNLLLALVHLDGVCDDNLILDALYRDVMDGVYSGFKKIIDSGEFFAVAGDVRTPSLLYIFHTLAALIHGDEETIRRNFSSPPPDEIPSLRYESYIESNLASYQLSIHHLEDAAKSVKKAMLAAQSIHSRGLARAYRLYALVNAVQGNIPDAIEYLHFAGEHAELSKDREELVIIGYYSSAVHYLFGNISKAGRLADHAESEAATCGMIAWGAKSRFLKGRILFEQGKYFDAYDMFESIAVTEENKHTLNAWKYRAKLYSGGFLPSGIQNDGDGAVFLIEAAYMNREYEKAVELADQFLVNIPDNNFIFIEQTDWQSGFSQTELLVLSKKDIFYRLASTYRALALSRLQSNESAAAEAISIMQKVTRDEKIHDTDTNDAFFFFAQYEVLQNTGSSETDLNTAVSMAFKRLQRRASQIDDIETKRAFLSLNRWNKTLGEAAKHHKLI